MVLKLFLSFTLIPVAEIYLIIKLGGLLGAFNTVLIIICTGFVGAYLARMQGMTTMMRVRRNMNQGIVPAEEPFDALLILIAGIVLLTPGFLTDIAGIMLLLPRADYKVNSLVRPNQISAHSCQGYIITRPFVLEVIIRRFYYPVKNQEDLYD